MYLWYSPLCCYSVKVFLPTVSTILGLMSCRVGTNITVRKHDRGRFLSLLVVRRTLHTLTYVRLSKSFSKAVKGRNVYTRVHLGEVFTGAYKKLRVRCRTLENLGNFKGLLTPAVRRVPGITRFQAFRISKEGSRMVVEVKRKMHHPNWLGFSPGGEEVGSGEGFEPLRILRSGAVRFHDTPPYELKRVDPEVIRQIEIRQTASQERLAAAAFGGEFGAPGVCVCVCVPTST